MQAVHQLLTAELGVQVQLLLHDEGAQMLKELAVAHLLGRGNRHVDRLLGCHFFAKGFLGVQFMELLLILYPVGDLLGEHGVLLVDI